MKKLLLNTITILLLNISVFAQTKISGSVKDNRGRIIAGASITLKGTYDGAITDSTGSFSFKSYEKGDFVLEAKGMGYKIVEQKLTLAKEPITANFILKEEINELKAVTVTAGAFEAGDKKRAATVMTSLDIVTTANSAVGDISGAVKTLPGAQQVGEQEGLFVRGGTGAETKQFIDGTLVNNPYYSSVPDIAQRGRFSPFLFKGTVFSTGGYSALYGDALSSALILESIDLPERSEIDASISTVFIGAGTQQLAKNKKSSYGINYGYTNVYPYYLMVPQLPDYYKAPEVHTAEGNFRIKTKSGGIIKFYSSFSHSALGLRRPNIDSSVLKNAFDIQNNNWYNNLSWRENLGKGWKMNLGVGFSTNGDVINQQIQDQNNKFVTTGYWYIDSLNYNLNNKQNLYQARAVFEKRLSGISALRFGGEHWYNYGDTKYKTLATTYGGIIKEHYTAVFGESDIYVTNDLAAKVGARFEHSSTLNRSNIAPRISLAYKTGKDAQMSAAYGVFYQRPDNTQMYYSNNTLDYTKATHYILNYQKMNRFYTFRVEAFYKKYDGLVKTYPTYNNNGSGYAQGIEVFWRDKKTFKNFDYWISYSYLDTKRDYLNFPGQIQPNFATTHTASIVTKKFITEWKTGFNFTYTYATGRPYYFMQQNNSLGKYEIKEEGTTKPYSSFNFSVNYLPNLGRADKTSIVIVGSVTNVFNNDLIYGYNYNHNGTIKQAVTPPAPQFFFVGVFLSWGVDRSQDAINNNL